MSTSATTRLALFDPDHTLLTGDTDVLRTGIVFDKRSDLLQRFDQRFSVAVCGRKSGCGGSGFEVGAGSCSAGVVDGTVLEKYFKH